MIGSLKELAEKNKKKAEKIAAIARAKEEQRIAKDAERNKKKACKEKKESPGAHDASIS